MIIFGIFPGICLGISVLYFFIILRICVGLSRLSGYKRSGHLPVTKVSVIIPARDEALTIGACLGDLELQDYPKDLFEVIVVDDGSTDATAAIVRNFAGRYASFNLSLIPNDLTESHQAFKKQAIRAAIEVSTGGLIITTDADTRSGPGWISAIVDYFEQSHPAMIIAPVAFHEEKTFFEKLAGMEFMGLMAATAGSCMMGFPLMCNGANLAFTREAYLETSGRKDDLRYPSGDDLFLMMKIRKHYGNKAVTYLLSEEAIVYTDAVKSPALFFSQRLRWVSKSRGYSNFQVFGTAVTTWVFNCILLVSLAAGCFNFQYLLIFLWIFGAKLLLEFYPVLKMTGFFAKKKLLFFYPLTQFLNIFYVTGIGLLANVLPYRWKGRTVRPA